MSDKEPQYNFGDIVQVSGYFPRLFEIDGQRIEIWRYKGEEWTDIIYEVYDVLSSDWIECCEDDITLVVEADKAEAYLEANPPNYEAPTPTMPDWVSFIIEEEGIALSKPKEPRKPTARELSAQLAKEQKEMRKKRGEQIDNLLDMRNWASEMLAKTGNEEFGDRVMAIDCELKKLTETE